MSFPMRKRLLLAGAATTLAAIAVTGCTDTGKTSPSKTPAPEATTSETVYNKCIDGASQVDAPDAKGPIKVADCAGINLITSDRAYQLGNVTTVTVEGNQSTVTIGGTSTKKIAVTGSNNHITYTGDAPEIVDEGTGNRVEKSS